MSDAAVVVADPVVVPLGALESVAEYRARRDQGETGEPVVAPAVEAKTPPVEPVAEPDAASDAGKALAAKKGSLQARIDDLTRKAAETERTLRAELDAARSAKPPDAIKPAPADKPKADSFSSYEDFSEALAEWKADQKIAALRVELEEQRAQQYVTSAQARVEAAAHAAHADFNEAIAAFVADGHQYSGPTADVILNHPLGHEIGYALAKDPATNTRLSAAPNPAVFYIEMGRFIAGLEGKAVEKPAAAAMSKAPAPIKPIGGSTTASGKADPADISSVAQWHKVRKDYL